MATFYMVCGPSGCGKSHFAKEFINQHHDIYYVSSDALRKELLGDESDQNNGHIIFSNARRRIVRGLRDGHDVFFDATNLKAAQRKHFIEMCRNAGADKCVCFAFYTDQTGSLMNQKLRERKVPNDVIARQCLQYKLPTEKEGWDEVQYLFTYRSDMEA